MLAAPVHFSAREFEQFNRMKQDCEMHFGDVTLAPNYAPSNGIHLAGKTLNMLCAQLKTSLTEFMGLTHAEQLLRLQLALLPVSVAGLSMQEGRALSAGEIEKGYYLTLINRYVHCYSLSTTIANALHELPAEAKEGDLALFHEITGYFRVLSCLLACNAILYSEFINELEHTNAVLPFVCVWTEQFETNHLRSVENNDAFMSFYKLYTQFFISLQAGIINKYKNDRVLPADLIKQVERKNALAQIHNRAYHGEVVYSSDTTRCFLPDPIAIERLVTKIKDVIKQGAYDRRQILFYLNTELGHVETIDVTFDPRHNKLTILNINSADGSAQHYLLSALSDALLTLDVDWQIYACQGGIQRDRKSCGILAFAYSGIVSKMSIDKICQPENLVEQPRFATVNAFEHIPLSPLEKVKWISLESLGEKAILIGQSFENMLQSLLKLHPIDKALQIRKDFMIEHGLNASGAIESKITYPQVLLKRMQARQNLPIGSAAIQARLKATDLYQALRRSAAGLGPIDDLTELIHAFDTLSLTVDVPDLDPTKGFTPLHLAVTKGLSRQTAKLLRHGASPDAATRTTPPKTAKTIYAELPEGSRFKAHNEIKSRLQ